MAKIQAEENIATIANRQAQTDYIDLLNATAGLNGHRQFDSLADYFAKF